MEAQVAVRPDLAPSWIDLADWVFPYYPHPKPTKIAERAYGDEHERAWVELVARHDGYIVVTPEYNHGYPAALKNALDYAYVGWNRKPMAFVSYGGSSGGVRAVEQLRLVAIELQLAPIRDEVNIPFIGRALDPQGVPIDELHRKRLEAMLGELAWWARALKAARDQPPSATTPS